MERKEKDYNHSGHCQVQFGSFQAHVAAIVDRLGDRVFDKDVRIFCEHDVHLVPLVKAILALDDSEPKLRVALGHPLVLQTELSEEQFCHGPRTYQ
jgi:hypothetical protein